MSSPILPIQVVCSLCLASIECTQQGSLDMETLREQLLSIEHNIEAVIDHVGDSIQFLEGLQEPQHTKGIYKRVYLKIVVYSVS